MRILKSLINHFVKSVVNDKRGIEPITLAALIGGGSSILGGFLGGRKKGTTTTPEPVQLPEFPEAAGARGTVSELLKKFGQMPGFGAISPNFADIFENARSKVRSFFGGSAVDPGVNARLKANLARRNVSQGPQAENLLLRSGVEEGRQIQDISTQQALQETQFEESGRRNFIQDLFRLAGLSPSFAVGSEVVGPQKGVGDVISSAGGIASSLFNQKSQRDLLEKILGGGAGQPGVSSLANIGGGFDPNQFKLAGAVQ